MQHEKSVRVRSLSPAASLALAVLAAPAAAQGVLVEWPVAPGGPAAAVSAGDVDLDGVADYAISETGAAGGAGVVRARSGASLDGPPLWTAIGLASGERFGSALAALGDVDGDGRADVAVAARATFTGNLPYVSVLSGADGSTLWTVAAPDAGSLFGEALARCGDLDGDGVAELLVGAARSLFLDGPGEVHVLSGATGATIRVLVGDPGRRTFGSAVAGARDLTGDGLDDVLVGDEEGARVTAHSGADGSVFLVLDGPADGFFGSAVAPVPDADNDGVGDVLVGAPLEVVVPGQNAGRVRLYSGADGALLHVMQADPTQFSFGSFVGALDDVDGDGVTDHLISAGLYRVGCCTFVPAETRVHSGASGALLLRGETGQSGTLAAVPDANGDGTRDFLFVDPSSTTGGVVALALTGLANPEPLCTAMTTAQGCAPVLVSSGTPSLTIGADLRLDAAAVPSGTVGLYAWSRDYASVPFGTDGVLCLAAPIHRFPVVSATSGEPPCSGGVGLTGTLSFPVPKPLLASLGVAPGETFVVQGWLRDPQAPPAEANVLTSALRVTVWP